MKYIADFEATIRVKGVEVNIDSFNDLESAVVNSWMNGEGEGIIDSIDDVQLGNWSTRGEE